MLKLRHLWDVLVLAFAAYWLWQAADLMSDVYPSGWTTGARLILNGSFAVGLWLCVLIERLER